VSDSRQRTTVHSHVISAPAQDVYALVADVSRWPAIFAPSLYVRHVQLAERTERFRLWALVNGDVKSWTSRRTRDPQRLHISFTQERTQPPFATMGGDWTFRPLRGNRSEVVLTHHFSTADGESSEAAAVAVGHNSEQELAALKKLAELKHPMRDIVLSFEDTVQSCGALSDAYQFVYRSGEWPQRLPHVSRVVLHEQPSGVQDMKMDTVTADGSTHTTRSIRLCFADERIVYKQLIAPALLFGHSGEWLFTDGPDATTITARHTVAIDPDAISGVLGTKHTLADARGFVRAALGANSRTTLAHAGAYAQSQARLSSGRAEG
jgi:aromatase